MNAKEHFDEDYKHVRRMLLIGKLKVEDVKSWIHQIGCRTETRMVKEKEEQLMRSWGTNADRETMKEQLAIGKLGDKDE